MPLVIGVVVTLAVVLVGAWAVGYGPASCGSGLTLRVAAAPEIAPALREIGDTFTAAKHKVGGEYVRVAIDATPAPTVASRLTVLAGAGIDVAAAPEPTPNDDQ